MIEIRLLKLLSIRQMFDKYFGRLNAKTLASQSIVLLSFYKDYFVQYDHSQIDFNVFKDFFFIQKRPNLPDEEIIEYKEILRQINEAEASEELVRAFEQQVLYESLHKKLDDNCDIVPVRDEINNFIEKYQKSSREGIEDMDIDRALTYIDRSKGLLWRCKALREHFQGGLIKSDFGLVAGYVDSGKTGFCISEAAYFAEQLTGDQYGLYLSNEGDWEDILPRVYCATIGCTIKALTDRPKDARIAYQNKMHGDSNRLLIRDIQGWSTADIERVLKERPPSFLIIDLMDHVLGFDRYQNQNEGSTERYKKLYQWARQMSTQYCPVLGVTQMNGDGENTMFPTMSKLSGSRVDKQAAAKFQLMIGSLHGNNTERYLSMPKNKITSNKNWKVKVQFDPLRTRFL